MELDGPTEGSTPPNASMENLDITMKSDSHHLNMQGLTELMDAPIYGDESLADSMENSIKISNRGGKNKKLGGKKGGHKLPSPEVGQ